MRRLAERSLALLALLLLAGSGSGVAQDASSDMQPSTPTVATLKQLVSAFNAHDLDAIMEFFAEDCELYMPKGKEPEGQRYEGKQAVREGLATRFAGVPDVRFGDDRHWVAGDLGVSTWLLTGTSRSGEPVRVRGVDLLEFRGGKIVKKDSYWKIVVE